MPVFEVDAKHTFEAARVAVVASRFNAEFTEPLLAGCLARLRERGVLEKHVHVARVPGAFEVPVAARKLALLPHMNYAAVICLGVLLRGETPHFDYLAQACAHGVAAVALESGVPCIFGVLTCDTEDQARARTGGASGHKGIEAADAALDMAGLWHAVAYAKLP